MLLVNFHVSLVILCFSSSVYGDAEVFSALSYDSQKFIDAVPTKPHFIKFYAPWCGHCKNLAPTWDELAVNYEGSDVAVIAKVDCSVHTPLCSSQEVTGYPTLKFYAPWCGHCQRLAPVWDSLANALEYSKSVVIGKVDCTQYGQICKDYEVRGYPTLLWIQDGKKVDKYSGDRSLDDLKEYVAKKLRATEEVTHGANEKQNSVMVLTSKNFVDTISSGITFVKYFAPWCGYCKRLAPTFEELSAKFNGHKLVKIAQVDCTEELSKDLCSEQQVHGFPTLLLYEDGKQIAEYDGDRSLADMAAFISQRIPHDEL